MKSTTEFGSKSSRSSILTNMETGLLLAQSDSNNLVDLNLLENLTMVYNDDESMAKTDYLLDP